MLGMSCAYISQASYVQEAYTVGVCRVRVAQCVYIALSGSRSQTYSTSIKQAPFYVLGCVRCIWVCLVYMGVLCVYDVRCVCECVCVCACV
jgi:hypothetical protein